MLGPIIATLLRLFGINISVSHSHTTVTNSIETLFGRSKWPWFWGSTLHGIPATLAIAVLILMHRHAIESLRLSLLYLALVWTWIGPVLIWRYEKITLVAFLQSSRRTLQSDLDFEFLEKECHRIPTKGVLAHAVLILWVAIIFMSFLIADKALINFGVVYGRGDPWWSLILVGALLYAYYTGIGFLLVLKTLRLTRLLSNLRLTLDAYHPDGRGGLRYVGRFASETSLMFASGILFVPLLLDLSYQTPAYLILIPVAAYSLSILVVFLIPIANVHSAVSRAKERWTSSIRSRIWDAFNAFRQSDDPVSYRRYLAYRDLLSDVRRISSWPSSAVGTLAAALPTAVGLAASLFKLPFVSEIFK